MTAGIVPQRADPVNDVPSPTACHRSKSKRSASLKRRFHTAPVESGPRLSLRSRHSHPKA